MNLLKKAVLMKPVRLTPRADSDIDACFAWGSEKQPGGRAAIS
jgi:hypothetical protein